MSQQAIEISARDGTIDATLHLPEGPGPWPGVVMLTDIRGPRPAFFDQANRLAVLGYAVLLPNVYYREGRAPVPDLGASMSDPATMPALFALMATLTPDRIRSDGAAEVEALLARPEVAPGPVAIVGYCMGGRFAIYAADAAKGEVGAIASYHGSGLIVDGPDSPHIVAANLAAACYFGHADADALVPAARLPELDATLAAGGGEFVSETYAGAEHGFTVTDSPAYDEAAAARHWRTLGDFLQQMLARG